MKLNRNQKDPRADPKSGKATGTKISKLPMLQGQLSAVTA
jgi:hypothetical protein